MIPDSRMAVNPLVWTKVPGTGLEVFSYSQTPVFVGVDPETGSLWLFNDPEWYPLSTLVVRKELE